LALKSPAPFRPTQRVSSSSRRSRGPRYLTPQGPPFDAPRANEEDASHRRLQPTYDTSTREPSDSRARGFHRLTRVRPGRARNARDTGSPCGGPASGHDAIDAAPRASIASATTRSNERTRRHLFGSATRPRRFQPRVEPVSDL
jgi:hypothetical protein